MTTFSKIQDYFKRKRKKKIVKEKLIRESELLRKFTKKAGAKYLLHKIKTTLSPRLS